MTTQSGASKIQCHVPFQEEGFIMLRQVFWFLLSIGLLATLASGQLLAGTKPSGGGSQGGGGKGGKGGKGGAAGAPAKVGKSGAAEAGKPAGKGAGGIVPAGGSGSGASKHNIILPEPRRGVIKSGSAEVQPNVRPNPKK
jgi:hypothetical protein